MTFSKYNIHQITYNIFPGDVLCFDNKRLLHGRTAMEGGESGGAVRRRMHGCYFDLDALFYSMRPVRRRVLTSAE